MQCSGLARAREALVRRSVWLLRGHVAASRVEEQGLGLRCVVVPPPRAVAPLRACGGRADRGWPAVGLVLRTWGFPPLARAAGPPAHRHCARSPPRGSAWGRGLRVSVWLPSARASGRVRLAAEGRACVSLSCSLADGSMAFALPVCLLAVSSARRASSPCSADSARVCGAYCSPSARRAHAPCAWCWTARGEDQQAFDFSDDEQVPLTPCSCEWVVCTWLLGRAACVGSASCCPCEDGARAVAPFACSRKSLTCAAHFIVRGPTPQPSTCITGARGRKLQQMPRVIRGVAARRARAQAPRSSSRP